RTLIVQIPGIRKDIMDGGKLVVNDPLIGISNTEFIVRKVTWKYPEGVTEAELGEFRPEIYEFEREFPSLTESASRSTWLTFQKYVARRLYLGGDGSASYPYTMVFSLKDAVSSSATINVGTPEYVDISMTLQIVGQYTRTYSNICDIRVRHGGAKQTIYLSPSSDLAYDYSLNNNYLNADASGNLTMKVQFFARPQFQASWTLWAPNPADATKYFTTTVSGIKRILPTTIGGLVVVYADLVNTGNLTLYWGQGTSFTSVDGSHFFSMGFELA
ncbi:MAG: hypothetical protein QXN77_09580, partial [Candidatus Caldarchaeum sp.]